MKYVTYLVIFGIVITMGCRSPGPSGPSEACPGLANAGSTGDLAEIKVRYIDDPDVSVVGMRCVGADTLLRVDVDVQNKSTLEQRIAYRFQWFEANGMTVGGDEAWKPLLLYPKELRTVRTAAPTRIAQDFAMIIKR